MARFVIRDAFIQINSVDLSDHATSVTIETTKEAVDATVFGDPGYSSLHGIPTDTFTVNFHQDFAASEVDATLWPLFDGETSFPVLVRPFPGSVSATNPSYSGTCKLHEYQPLQGEIGEISETEIEFVVQGKITRSTTT